MEKNQHKNSSKAETLHNTEATGLQPGQQLPAGAETGADATDSKAGEPEQHSESSFPKNGETIGTP